MAVLTSEDLANLDCSNEKISCYNISSRLHVHSFGGSYLVFGSPGPQMLPVH